MTIKINVGVNKKVGLPDYGSAGSHCNIEIEADNSILDDAEQFSRRINNAYELARQSVEEELSHHRPSNATSQSRSTGQSNREPERQQDNRSDNRYDNSSDNKYIASSKQQNFIASLVKAIKGLSWQTLDRYCGKRFGKNVSQLSPKQASELIDDLKAAKDGRKEIAA